ncbi:MAG: hypothetical protein ILP09_01605 [Oscillospiraceae bacterium]|nr:hypothetical protein [Oscillospiraceae bacterium]
MTFYGDIRRGRRDLLHGAEKKTRSLGTHTENPRDTDAAHGLSEDGILFPSVSNVNSFTECTGLMPSPPADDEAREAYKDLSPMEIPNENGQSS